MKLIRLYDIDEEYGYDCHIGLFKSLTSAKRWFLEDVIKEEEENWIKHHFRSDIIPVVKDRYNDNSYNMINGEKVLITNRLTSIYIEYQPDTAGKIYTYSSHYYEVIDTKNLT